jgi:hypothetical protein
MAGKSFTRYFRDPAFRAAVDRQFELADRATKQDCWITYAIHDPTTPDCVGESPEGPIIYVGQTKEFGRRVRKRMRAAGTAKQRPTDRIDGASYEIMRKGGVPTFTVLDRVPNAIESLVSETNWTKRLRKAGYRLLNQWTEQKFGGDEIDRRTVPHDWLWPLTASDAIGSRIDLIITDPADGESITADLATFPPNARLREIRDHIKAAGRKVRLTVRD